MKFTLSHSRAVTGNDISVQVEADDGDALTLVTSELDGFSLAEDDLSPPDSSYDRSFNQAGLASPAMDHVLNVSATASSGKTRAATHRWTDET